MSQPPSVARNVHYVDREGRCLAAMVTRVDPDSDGTVDLTVFGPQALQLPPAFGVLSVPHVEDASVIAEEHPPGTWHWPERV